MSKCINCGSELPIDANHCPVCGYTAKDRGVNNNQNAANSYNQTFSGGFTNNAYTNIQKSRLLAGILGLLFGSIGVHNFYLGYTTRAVIQIIVTVVTCGIGGIWGFIEGILILCRQINIDGYGNALKDDC